MHTTVLKPLGMTSSTYKQPLPEAVKARATIEHDTEGRPFPGERLHFPGLAAGGLWTTPADLARFAIEVMRSYRGESNLVISQALTREMVKPQISMGPPSPLADSYGLGFDIAAKAEPLYILHTGGTWGSTCILWAYPGTGQGAVVMTNCAAANGMIRFEILLSIAMAYGWPLD